MLFPTILTVIGVIVGYCLCICIGWKLASETKEIEYKDVIDENEILTQQNKDLVSRIAELSKQTYYGSEWRG